MTSRYGHMVHEYYVERFRKILDERVRKIDSLNSAKDAADLVKDTRHKILKCFGRFPEKNSLNVRKIG
ncbi:MAG: hypothetical protein WC071_08230, partial [Victivallaceae bacterium]